MRRRSSSARYLRALGRLKPLRSDFSDLCWFADIGEQELNEIRHQRRTQGEEYVDESIFMSLSWLIPVMEGRVECDFYC